MYLAYTVIFPTVLHDTKTIRRKKCSKAILPTAIMKQVREWSWAAIGCQWALLCLLFLDCHCSHGLSCSPRLSQSCTSERQTALTVTRLRAGENAPGQCPSAIPFDNPRHGSVPFPLETLSE